MKKTILILLFINSLNADFSFHLEYIDNTNSTYDICISEYTIVEDSFKYKRCGESYTRTTSLSYLYSTYNIVVADSITGEIVLNYVDGVSVLDTSDKLSNYTLDETLSLNSENLTILGLSDNDLNFSFAFSGILMSFLFLFGIFKFI